MIEAGKTGTFKVKQFYQSLLTELKISFHKEIWHKLKVPKHRFILWQVVHSNLLTRDLLAIFIHLDCLLCPVCEFDLESHGHLFFACPFTKKVILEVTKWLGQFDWPPNLEEWLIGLKGRRNSLVTDIKSTVVAAVTYMVWCSRNNCAFEVFWEPTAVLSKRINLSNKARVIYLNHVKLKNKEKDVINLINNF
uniref:Reverse transcriptase zinc-binding domain-containing protein n=1 Tax=Cannabis sativa TaxID=3483 RepID=A0A803PLP0_CANSA